MTMKLNLGLAAAAAAMLLTPCAMGEAPGRTAAIEQIMQADRDFAAMAAEQGVQVAFGTYMDAVEGRMVSANGDPIRGEAEIRAAFEGYPDGVLLHWFPVEGFASEAGDFGVTWGEWSLHSEGSAETKPDERGRYVTVWQLNAAGEWRGILDLGNDDTSYQQIPVEEESPDAAGDH